MAWEEFVTDYKKTAPVGLNNCFQNSHYFWAFIDGEDALFEGAVYGIVISVTLAFIILLFATLNVIISFFAILTVACICSTVVAVMVLLDW